MKRLGKEGGKDWPRREGKASLRGVMPDESSSLRARLARVAAGAGPDWVVAGLLAGAVGWALYHLGGYRPEALVVPSGLVALAGLVEGARRVVIGGAVSWAAWAPVPFLAYAGWNVAVVSPVPWAGWVEWWGWAMAAVVYFLGVVSVRDAGARWGLGLAVVAMAVATVGVQVYQWWVDPAWLPMGRVQAEQFIGRRSGTFGIPNSQAAWLLLVLPVLVAALAWPGVSRLGRWGGGAVALWLVLGVGLTISRGPWLAAVGVAVIWPVVALAGDWRRRVAVAAGVALAGAVVGAILYGVSSGVRERWDALVAESGERTRPIMWRGAWELGRESPWVGTGAASYNVRFETYRPEGYRDEPKWAHQDYLNTWSDYGVLGVMLLFGVAAWIVVRRWRVSGAGRSGVGFALAVMGLMLLIDFHLKIPALAMGVAWLMAELGRVRPGERLSGLPGGRWVGVVMVVTAAAWGVVVPRGYALEGQRFAARSALEGLAREEDRVREQAVASEARAALVEVVARWPEHRQAWADLAYAEALAVRHTPGEWVAGGRRAEEAARRALAGGQGEVVVDFWLRLAVALDMQGRWTEAGAALRRALELAPRQPLVWYHQAYHLSLRPATRGLARAAVATCLRLDPGNRAAEALRVELRGAHSP